MESSVETCAHIKKEEEVILHLPS